MTAESELEKLAGELEHLQDELSELVTAPEPAPRESAPAAESAAAPTSAYEALWQDGELQPWTSAAIRMWEEQAEGGADSEVVHHLAIAHHARAYDLEAAGDDAAFGHFEQALRHWAALHGDPGFWRRAHDRLAGAMGVPVPDDVVAKARAALPYQLLEPHLTLAARLRPTDPGRARRHVRLVTGSAFPAAVVAEARAGLVRDVLDDIPRAVAEGAFEETLDTLETWLLLDPDSHDLLRALLFTSRSWIERLRTETYTARHMDELLGRVDRLARPGLDRTGPPAGELARELARHEYFLALRSFGALGRPSPSPDALGSLAEVEEARRDAERAARQVERALELYPELAREPRYAEAEELRGTELPRFRAWLNALEAQFRLTSFGVGREELAGVRRLLDEAGSYTAADPELEGFVRSLENLYSIRRA